MWGRDDCHWFIDVVIKKNNWCFAYGISPSVLCLVIQDRSRSRERILEKTQDGEPVPRNQLSLCRCGWQTLKTRILFELGFDPGASQPSVQDLGIREEKGEEKVIELLLPWHRLAPRLRCREQEAPFTLCSFGPRKNDDQP